MLWGLLRCIDDGGPRALALSLAAYLRGLGLSPEIAITALVTAWCVAWWVFEPVPIPVTSLLPLALLPLLGVLTPAQVS